MAKRMTFNFDLANLQAELKEMLHKAVAQAEMDIKKTKADLFLKGGKEESGNLFVNALDLYMRMANLLRYQDGFFRQETKISFHNEETALDLLAKANYVHGFLSALSSIRWALNEVPTFTWFVTEIMSPDDVCIRRSLPTGG